MKHCKFTYDIFGTCSVLACFWSNNLTLLQTIESKMPIPPRQPLVSNSFTMLFKNNFLKFKIFIMNIMPFNLRLCYWGDAAIYIDTYIIYM